MPVLTTLYLSGQATSSFIVLETPKLECLGLGINFWSKETADRNLDLSFRKLACLKELHIHPEDLHTLPKDPFYSGYDKALDLFVLKWKQRGLQVVLHTD